MSTLNRIVSLVGIAILLGLSGDVSAQVRPAPPADYRDGVMRIMPTGTAYLQAATGTIRLDFVRSDDLKRAQNLNGRNVRVFGYTSGNVYVVRGFITR